MRNPGDLFGADPKSIAIVDLLDPANPREISYGAMQARSDGVAAGLRAAGFAKGARVAIASANRVAFYEVFFGAMKAGCVPLPINIRLQEDSLRELIRRNDADIVFADATQAERIGATSAAPIRCFDRDYESFLRAERFVPVDLADDDVAMQPFTSGTTGLPKGIVLTARNVAWAHRQMMPPGRAPDPTIAATVAHPLYHKNAMLGSKGVFMNGGRVVMMERFVPELFAQAIGRWRVTKVHTVPSMMARIMADPALAARIDQSSIREIHMGSAPVTRKLFDAIRRAFPTANVRISYGVTEAGPMQFGEHPRGVPRPPLSIGHGLPECELRLVEGPSPDEGVLHVRNPGVMRCYYGLPEETKARFSGDGWYVTGDILRRDAQGFHFFVGRADDMFVCNGNNLYPATVEETLLKHDAVRAVAVVAVPDEIRGEVPHAFVVRERNRDVQAEALQRFCLDNAPPYQHPRRIHFVDELPLAGTGKIDTRRLKAIALERLRDGAP